MQLIDTHCHLASRQFNNIPKEILVKTALEAGVKKMISLGASLNDWDSNIEWSRQFPEVVHTCLGIHPNDAAENNNNWAGKLKKSLHTISLAAIGETGLDYYHPAPNGGNEETFHQTQQSLLEEHFELAASLGLNIVLHTRDRQGSRSFDDAIAIAKQYAGKVRPVFHCFIGSQQQALTIFDKLDGLISFTGIATFKNSTDIADLARWVPANKFMLETDSPYLSPEPKRGKMNQPAYLTYLAEKISSLRNETLEAVAEQTYQTACSFFNIL